MLTERKRVALPPPEPPTLPIGTLERRFANLPCGRVSYLRHGTGRPLLLVHGIPTSARLWEPLLGDLGREFDCIVPDLLGLGRSQPAPGADLSSIGQVGMLVELLDALGVGEFALALHDQGGAHGQQLIMHHGERVRALALCDVVCYDNWLVPVVSAMSWMARRPGAMAALAGAGVLKGPMRRVFPFPQTTVRAPLPDALVDDWFWALDHGGEPLRHWCAYVRSQSPRFTAEAVPALRAWTKPALVMWAAQDRFLVPSWGARLAHEIPGAQDRPVLLPFAGHFFHPEVPVSAAAALGEFFTAA